MNISVLKEKFAKCNVMQNYLHDGDNQMDVHELTHACIVEISGEPRKANFNNNSEIALWYAQRQNLVREIIMENNIEEVHPSKPKL